INNSSTSASVLQTVNFSSYSGSGRYIAFRNILAPGYSGDFSLNYIDDITLSLAASKDLDGNGNDVSDNEPLSQKWMTVFPNPTSGMVTIEADGEIKRIDIFDYTGRCVATFEHQSSVDLSRFAAGLYTLRCTLPDRIEVRRVVKQ
ncbi:MAG: T9SS type A sorting domain-containing protein, partial [Bacteroidales bacterium]|nr:T9SS type A sorting domain-containing protein [Bacteroidales bacterium]